MNDTDPKILVAAPIELKSEVLFKLWLALTQAQKFGISEAELIKQSGWDQERVLQALMPHINSSVVTHRIRQTGTDGTTEHFYALTVPAKIMVVPTP